MPHSRTDGPARAALPSMPITAQPENEDEDEESVPRSIDDRSARDPRPRRAVDDRRWLLAGRAGHSVQSVAEPRRRRVQRAGTVPPVRLLVVAAATLMALDADAHADHVLVAASSGASTSGTTAV